MTKIAMFPSKDIWTDPESSRWIYQERLSHIWMYDIDMPHPVHNLVIVDII